MDFHGAEFCNGERQIMDNEITLGIEVLLYRGGSMEDIL